MKKSQLKSGMMVCYANSDIRHLILIGTQGGDVICNLMPEHCDYGGLRHINYFELSNYNEDLTKNCLTGSDISKVYSAYGQLLWERKDDVRKALIAKADALIVIANRLKEQANNL